MSTPIWHTGDLEGLRIGIGSAVCWYVRLDTIDAERAAARAALSAADLSDFAVLPQAEMRSLRRRLTKALLAQVASTHPDRITIRRCQTGALRVEAPGGWYVSVAGQWPHCLIGLATGPIGVDVEPIDAEPPPSDVFTRREQSDLFGASRVALIRRWLAKEAHAKAVGMASQIDPVEINTLEVADGLIATSAAGQTTCRIHLVDGAVLSLALSFAPTVVL
ncbi:4'-phosphopantetheinyl transferase superfamily protein [Sphingomonas sp. AP4-R1]|uniref:4'-phosphopantetheinyl transferase superfamily protein n=1 Tax=Sphingomonas sp. AP4-R1 TaxID=2735134 RepID=UPI00149350E7|nr:4'-phosphopantetheinyl transferase superfamily protein [Sphingomonas sp. AP4-R1]QJU58387.1 4'-phosphopantetheinyl transferase superfamily protein [Sphingomonas sp. AP4-R1]